MAGPEITITARSSAAAPVSVVGTRKVAGVPVFMAHQRFRYGDVIRARDGYGRCFIVISSLDGLVTVLTTDQDLYLYRDQRLCTDEWEVVG
jgi:hypothetical protein